MRVLLDNCVHYGAKTLFPTGHEIVHARDRGWRGLSNGELISRAAASQFEVLATTDKKIRYEHNLPTLPLTVLELNSRFTRIEDLRTLGPHLPAALEAAKEYRFVSLAPDGTLELVARRA